MTATPYENIPMDNLVAAARELIRNEEGGCVVHIHELIEGLRSELGERFGVLSDAYRMIALVERLWEDPHIDHPDNGFIEFVWNEKGWSRNEPTHDQPQAQRREAARSRFCVL
jgi:hypothetical protein